MEHYPSSEHTNAEVIDRETARKRHQAGTIAESADGLPTRQQAGGDVIAITDRLDARTKRTMGGTTDELRGDTARLENYTDPDDGETKDLDWTTQQIEADANGTLQTLGLDEKVDPETVRSATIAASLDEDVRGLHGKAAKKRNEDVVTDATEETVEKRVVLEVIKHEIDDGAEIYSLADHVKKRLGKMGVADMVSLDTGGTKALYEELRQPAHDQIVGYSADGEEQTFVHTTESGPFLMNVLNGRSREAMKDLTKDGQEQLAARIEDYQDKYGVNHLSDARLEVRDLQRLERIFLRNNKNIRIAQAYQDKQYEPENVLAA